MDHGRLGKGRSILLDSGGGVAWNGIQLSIDDMEKHDNFGIP